MGAGAPCPPLALVLAPAARAALPTGARWRRAVVRAQPYQNWLTPEARQLQKAALASETVAVAPLWWPGYLREVASERGLRRGTQTQSALCASRGGSFEAPLLAPAFLASLARLGGRLGLGERSAAMRAVFSPLLDDAIVSRRSKATFGDVFWGPASRQLRTIGTVGAWALAGSTQALSGSPGQSRGRSTVPHYRCRLPGSPRRPGARRHPLGGRPPVKVEKVGLRWHHSPNRAHAAQSEAR